MRIPIQVLRTLLVKADLDPSQEFFEFKTKSGWLLKASRIRKIQTEDLGSRDPVTVDSFDFEFIDD